jgi:hypothetical protein
MHPDPIVSTGMAKQEILFRRRNFAMSSASFHKKELLFHLFLILEPVLFICTMTIDLILHASIMLGKEFCCKLFLVAVSKQSENIINECHQVLPLVARPEDHP